MIGRNGSAAASSHPQRPNQYQGSPTVQNLEVVWDQITDTPTTLDGYGITDAYTITEVDGLLALKVDKATLTTRGDLFVRDATVVTRLGIGTSGKFLRSDGTDPSWQNILSTDLSDFNEAAQDAVGNILVDSSTVDFSYVDGTNTITASVIASALSIAYTQLTYSGLTAGQALVASGATAASFRALTAADIGAGTFGSGDFAFPAKLTAATSVIVGTLGSEVTTGLTATILGQTRLHAHRYANPGQMAVSRSNGSAGSPSAVLSGEQIGGFVFGGYDGTSLGQHSSLIAFASENWSSTAHGFRFTFATVPSGSTTATTRFTLEENGNVLMGSISQSALSTSATDGFFYVRSCAGTPTGTPTLTPTGSKPMVYDHTNNKLYVYNGGAWKGVTLA